jgi:hypothetical protein
MGWCVVGEVQSVSPEIGYRFAGYVDGEGHFAINRATKPSGTFVYGCTFVIHIRDDDRHVLERFQVELGGIGAMYEVGARFKPGQTNTKPTVMWHIQNKAGCLFLVEVFEQYRLWTKKAGDFHIWAKAVRYLHGPRPEGKAPLERWFHEIRASRKYDAPLVSQREVQQLDALMLWEDDLDE